MIRRVTPVSSSSSIARISFRRSKSKRVPRMGRTSKEGKAMLDEGGKPVESKAPGPAFQNPDKLSQFSDFQSFRLSE